MLGDRRYSGVMKTFWTVLNDDVSSCKGRVQVGLLKIEVYIERVIHTAQGNANGYNDISHVHIDTMREGRAELSQE